MLKVIDYARNSNSLFYCIITILLFAAPVSGTSRPTGVSPSSGLADSEAAPSVLLEKAINNDLIITFSEFPLGTQISDQYSDLGIVFSGDNPFITLDGSNPTSPVLSGTPLFQGAIEGLFVDPDDGSTPSIVSGFSLDAGFFDALGSVRLQWFDLDGQLLGQRAGSQFGIENFQIEGGSIHRWRIEVIMTEPAGFGIDNVSFLSAPGASLLFREKRDGDKDGTWGFGDDAIPGFDHVGFHFNDLVYESHPGYPAGQYVSSDGNESVSVVSTFGVQAQHSRGTFEHDARFGEDSPVIDFEEVLIGDDLALSMRNQIDDFALGAPFQPIDFSFPLGIANTLSPSAQKGGGGSYTCVGLVEWAAESAGHKGGQGFVPNWLESFTFPTLDVPPELYEAPLLSPQLLSYVAKLDAFVGAAGQWLQGFLDPVDFVITDPLGRRLGRTPELGEIEEIPGAFYSGDGNLEQFLIPNPLPGDYQVTLVGRGENVLGAFNVGGQVEVVDEPLAQGELMDMSIDVGSVPGSRGDLDGDGDVDSDDLAILQSRLNVFVNDLNDPGDMNSDGLLDQADVDLLTQLCTRPGCAVGVGVTCAANPDRLCRQMSRFEVEVSWRDFRGETGSAHVVPFGSDDSGLLWFFDPNNWEMLVKILDGCGVNGHFWVFSAATTNVEYTLRVRDTLTGSTKIYFNPLGNSAPAITDTSAFNTCDGVDRLAQKERIVQLGTVLDDGLRKEVTRGGAKQGLCSPSATELCLGGQRFQVEVNWRDFEGQTGSAQVVPVGSADSGLFWFFDEDNWEMLIKVLDGCGLNDRYWVFAAATTNVEYTLTVTDTETGMMARYANPLGNAAAAITDTDALAVCP